MIRVYLVYFTAASVGDSAPPCSHGSPEARWHLRICSNDPDIPRPGQLVN